MPHPAFFAQLGLFIVNPFLSQEDCTRLRMEASTTAVKPATINDDSGMVDTVIRKTSRAGVSDETVVSIKSHLMALKPQLEAHFQVKLTDCEPPQFLIYSEGFFYRQHQDSSNNPNMTPDEQRKVSTVLFLNHQTDAPSSTTYSGGSLTFYGLMKEAGWESYGLPLIGQAGVLVAFSSAMKHEVKPVLGGERYTVVTWFR